MPSSQHSSQSTRKSTVARRRTPPTAPPRIRARAAAHPRQVEQPAPRAGEPVGESPAAAMLPARWPEMAEYVFAAGSHELRLFRHDAAPEAIDAVQSGAVEFSLVAGDAVMFLLFRIGSEGAWSYVPVSWWLLPRRDQLPDELPFGARTVVRVSLIDADSGVARAGHECALTAPLSYALHHWLRAQAGQPTARRWSGQRYTAQPGTGANRQLEMVYEGAA